MKRVYKDKRWFTKKTDKPTVKRESNAAFVLYRLNKDVRLVLLLKNRSEQLCSMPWKVRETVAFWANRFVGVLS